MAEETKVADTWYMDVGEMQDVVVATRSVLSRNLANFPFPQKLQSDESERVLSIVFDAFNYLKDPENYQTVPVERLDSVGEKIMVERGILQSSYRGQKSGIILRSDGRVSCTVNTDDHIRLSSFCSGLDIDSSYKAVYDIDSELQKRIQFAASYEFGYLNSSILNSGSGLTFGVKFHLPACSLLNMITSLSQEEIGREFSFTATYGSGGIENVSGFGGTGSSLGAYYILQNATCAQGSELDQIASIRCAVQKVVKKELEARKKCRDTKLTIVENYAFRALALAKNSFFISLREAIEIISGVKLGKDMGIFSGIEYTTLHALLYRIQEGHLEYVLSSGEFKFEEDIQDDKARQIDRLRALILQEAFHDVKR